MEVKEREKKQDRVDSLHVCQVLCQRVINLKYYLRVLSCGTKIINTERTQQVTRNEKLNSCVDGYRKIHGCFS